MLFQLNFGNVEFLYPLRRFEKEIKENNFCLDSSKKKQKHIQFSHSEKASQDGNDTSDLIGSLPVFAAYSFHIVERYAIVEAWKHSSICVCRSFFS